MLVTPLEIQTLVKLIAGPERGVPDAGDAAAYRDAGQAGAVKERILPDAGDAAGNDDAGQLGAFIERILPDIGDACGNRDAGQAGYANARAPMLTTPLPIVTLVRPVQ